MSYNRFELTEPNPSNDDYTTPYVLRVYYGPGRYVPISLTVDELRNLLHELEPVRAEYMQDYLER